MTVVKDIHSNGEGSIHYVFSDMIFSTKDKCVLDAIQCLKSEISDLMFEVHGYESKIEKLKELWSGKEKVYK